MMNFSDPKFGGIYAHYNAQTLQQYTRAFTENPDDHALKPFATRIFRELPTTLAMPKNIRNSPTDVHILGCSYRSEAYAYGIALRDQSKNVHISALDYTPYLVELAKTGHIVCADIEKEWVNNTRLAPGNPLAGQGWDRYLEKASQPEGFDSIIARNPELAQITRDTVSNVSIGNGMDWYKVNLEGLPSISFDVADMRDYVKKGVGERTKQVYVMANSLAYIAQQEGGQGFLKVLQDIQNNNVDHETYIVLGDAESHIFREFPALIQYVKMLGFVPVSEAELKRLGVPRAEKTFGDIWKSAYSVPINLQFQT